MFLNPITEEYFTEIIKKYNNVEELINEMKKVLEFERNIAVFYFKLMN